MVRVHVMRGVRVLTLVKFWWGLFWLCFHVVCVGVAGLSESLSEALRRVPRPTFHVRVCRGLRIIL